MTSLNLPREYLERPFTVNEGLAAGLTVSALRNPLLHRETRSVRSLGPPDDLQGRARAFAAALPSDVAFSHIASARLLDCPCHRESLTPHLTSCVPRTGRGSGVRAVAGIGGWRLAVSRS